MQRGVPARQRASQTHKLVRWEVQGTRESSCTESSAGIQAPKDFAINRKAR